MSPSLLSLLCIAFWLIPGGEQKNVPTKEASFPPEFIKLLNLLDDGGVTKLEILHIPQDVETPVRITVEAFRHRVRFKITVSEFQGTGDNKSLSKALKEASVVRGRPKYDVRWAIVFFDRFGAERGTIYLGQFGEEGQMGNFTFKPGPHLLPWIKSLIRYGFE